MSLARAIALIAALSFSPAARAQTTAPQTPPPAPVRVMTYNIRIDVASDTPSWTERRPHMAAQIAFTDPDLLGVQEAAPPMTDWLAEQLPALDRYGVGRDDGAGTGESTTIFWRRDRFEAVSEQTLWCSPTPDRPSKGWDAAYPRTITRVVLRDRRDGRLWDVRNTHFDHIGEEARRRCAELAVGLAPVEGASVILMGDLNTGPDSVPYARIAASGLRDARAISPVVFGPAGTFNAFDITKDNDGVAIDHVFVGDGLSVIRFGVLTDSFGGRVISDHFPLVVDLVPEAP